MAARVSSIVPVFNGERYLEEAINSMLAQEYPDMEVLIVDDGSTDDTAAIARSYGGRIRYRYQPNAGLSAARNTGIRETSGDLIAFLDADDVWSEEKIVTQIRYLNAHPAVDAVFAHMESFISPDLDEDERSKLAAPPPVQPAWSAGTMLARRGAMAAVGEFSPDVRIGEFMEWLFRAREAGLELSMHPATLMRRRLHQTNMGRDDQASRAEYARILKQALDRRRSAGDEGG